LFNWFRSVMQHSVGPVQVYRRLPHQVFDSAIFCVEQEGA